MVVSELGNRVVHYKSEIESTIQNDDLSDEDESEGGNSSNNKSNTKSKSKNIDQTKFIQEDMITMPLKPSDNKKVQCEVTVIN